MANLQRTHLLLANPGKIPTNARPAMNILERPILTLALAAAAAALAGCTDTTHEVEVVHDTPAVHHTSTAPEDFNAVNQYDRQSR
jgi:hypothetical protein